MSAIPRLGSDASAAEVARELHGHGAVIVERLAPPDLCDAVTDQLAPWLEATPYGADGFSGRSTRRTGGLLTRCPATIDLVGHPLVLDTCQQVLWPNKSSFQLHLTQAIAIGPDSPAQMLHRDHWCFDMFPFPTGVDVEVSTIWALDDFTEANGATRVIPDSHRLADEEVRSFTPADTQPAEMPRGSVVMYLGSTVHGGGANTTDRVRTGLNVDYVLGWLRQEENQYLTYSLDEVRAMPERIQRLLGYQLGAYALGYIEGGRDPMTLLGHGSGAGQTFAPA